VPLDLDVEAHVHLGADVVGDHVVCAADSRVFQRAFEDLPPEVLGRCGADEVAHVVADDLGAGVKDPHGDDTRGDRVEDRRAERRPHHPEKRRAGGEDVVAIVQGGGDDRGGVSLAADRQAVPVEPELRRCRGDQHDGTGRPRLDTVGPVQYRCHGVPEHYPARYEDAERDEEGDERLDPLVAVGVLEVRGLCCEVQPREDDQAVRHVGEAVDRLRPDREAPGEPPDPTLRGHQDQVDAEHDRAYAADGPSPVVAHW
jgi:hypothetical protein